VGAAGRQRQRLVEVGHALSCAWARVARPLLGVVSMWLESAGGGIPSRGCQPSVCVRLAEPRTSYCCQKRLDGDPQEHVRGL
jgi:hypothetical protein